MGLDYFIQRSCGDGVDWNGWIENDDVIYEQPLIKGKAGKYLVSRGEEEQRRKRKRSLP